MTVNRSLTRGVLASAGFLLAVASGAQGSPPIEDPEQLARRALAESPTLASLGHRLDAAREAAAAADALPGPMTELMIQNAGLDELTLGEAEMSMLGVEIRQLLPGSRKLGARREAALAESARVAADEATLRRQVLAEIRTAWAGFYALDEERRVLEVADEILELLAQVAAARLATADADLTAALRARLEQARLAERRIDLDAARALLVARLERLVDTSGGGLTIAPIAALPPVDFPPKGWPAEVVRESASVAAAQATIEAAERRVASSRQELRPDYLVGGGVGYRGDLDPMVIARFGVAWSAWSSERLKPRVRSAERELEAAREELRAAEYEARAAAARADALRRQAEAQLVRVREGSLPLAGAALDAARSAYAGGRGEFSSVVLELEEWLEVRIELARREAERYAAWAAVRELVPGPSDRELLGEMP